MIAKRLSLSLLAVAATAAVVSYGTFALFSASTTNANNTFTSGTVTLGAPVNDFTAVTNIAPGDSGAKHYSVQYTGSLDAWLGLDATLGGPLTACDSGGRFTASISDGTSSYGMGMNQVIGSAPVHPGATVNLTINWALHHDAGNDCQNKSAQIGITVHAVQSRNNTNGGGTGPIDWN